MSLKVKTGLACIYFDSFWGFSQSEYAKRAAELAKVCSKMTDTAFFALPEAFCDAEGALQAAKTLNTDADFAILDVATFPEGKAAITFFDNLTIPFALWSRDETVHENNLGHNSFCGANFIAGNLALKGRRFRSFYGDVKSVDFQSRLVTATSFIKAAKMAAGSRIGLFGEGIVPKFYDIDISTQDRQTLVERWNIEFVGIPMDELIRRADSYKPTELDPLAREFKSKFATVKISDDDFLKLAGLLAAIKDISAENNFASLTVRCWPELPDGYGVWPCSVLSVLNDMGLPAACEGDTGGALDMLLASKLSNVPSTLLDIVDWDSHANAFSIWHCGPTACSWADKSGTQLICHNVDGKTKDGSPALGKPAVVDMQFEPGDVTVFRTLGAIDDEFIVQGKLAANSDKKICGSFGYVTQPMIYSQKVTVEQIRNEIFKRTLPHHYAAARNISFS